MTDLHPASLFAVHADRVAPDAAILAEPDAVAPVLIDRFGRRINYLRIAVNEVCNLRCVYCMPAQGLDFRTGDAILSDAEILRLARICAGLGINKIRFTGGEPTLRRGLVDLVAATAQIPGITHVALTTNGLRLERLASRLKAAGLSSVNISLDSLRPARFKEITRRDGLDLVLRGVEAALSAGLESVKLNSVMMRGVNADEIADFVALTRHSPLGVRFIEFMPFDSRQTWGPVRFLSSAEIREHLFTAWPDLQTITGTPTEQFAYRVPGYVGTVAIIPAYTRSLCGACNRLRLTADGKIRNCLYATHEYDVLAALRRTHDDTAIARVLRVAVANKVETGWHAQQDGDTRTSMSQIGG